MSKASDLRLHIKTTTGEQGIHFVTYLHGHRLTHRIRYLLDTLLGRTSPGYATLTQT